MIWWERGQSTRFQPDAIRNILDRLDADAGASRRRWALERPALLARCEQAVEQGKAVLLTGTPTHFHVLAEQHDAVMTLAFSAADLLRDVYLTLGTLRQAALLTKARLADVTQQRTGAALWRRSGYTGELRELKLFQEEIVIAEITLLSSERDRLEGAATMLLAQGRQMRERLLAAFNGPANKWLSARGEWLRVGLENWERAQKGLRLLPLPAINRSVLNVRLEGVVKWYDESRRRGMITPLGGGPDVHLPRSSLRTTSQLVQGQRVGYTLRQSIIGPWAADVILIR